MDHYVYIISNANRTLYVGLAWDIVRRIEQHKNGTFENAFTRRYNFDRLVYFETLSTRSAAAKREKQIKSWPRAQDRADRVDECGVARFECFVEGRALLLGARS